MRDPKNLVGGQGLGVKLLAGCAKMMINKSDAKTSNQKSEY